MDEIGVGWKSSCGNLLVKLKDVPTGRAVFDAKGEKVGELLDVIGPVKSPVGIVACKGKHRINESLFVQ